MKGYSDATVNNRATKMNSRDFAGHLTKKVRTNEQTINRLTDIYDPTKQLPTINAKKHSSKAYWVLDLQKAGVSGHLTRQPDFSQIAYGLNFRQNVKDHIFHLFLSLFLKNRIFLWEIWS